MRLFLAIYPPKDLLDQLRDARRHFDKEKRNLQYIPIDQLHVTLRFIGPGVSQSSYKQVADAIASVADQIPKIELIPEKLIFGFPKQTFPKYLLLDVKASKSLMEASDIIHNELRNLKLRDTIRWKEKHTNSFHITIARLKPNATKKNSKLMKGLLSTYTKNTGWLKSEIPQIQLVESMQVGGNIQYKKLDLYNLGG